MVIPTFFSLSLNFTIRSSWSEPQSAPDLIFADCVELLLDNVKTFGILNLFSIFWLRKHLCNIISKTLFRTVQVHFYLALWSITLTCLTLVTLRTMAHLAPLSRGFSRKEVGCCCGLLLGSSPSRIQGVPSGWTASARDRRHVRPALIGPSLSFIFWQQFIYPHSECIQDTRCSFMSIQG